MDRMPLVVLLLAAYFAATLFAGYDAKRIEAQCKLTTKSDRAHRTTVVIAKCDT